MKIRFAAAAATALLAVFTVNPVWADDGEYASYEKLDTVAGWIEFIDKNPESKSLEKARKKLLSAFEKEGQVSISVAHGGTAVECRGGSITQTEMIQHLRAVGSAWTWACENPGSFSYKVKNTSKSHLYVRLRAHDQVVDVLAGPGKTATGTMKMTSACTTELRQSAKHTFSFGKVTFHCNEKFTLMAVSPADAEAKKFPSILAEEKPAQLEDFIKQFPKSPLVAAVRDKITAIQQKAREALLKQMSAKMTLGAKPAKLVDGQTYSLTLNNPTGDAVIVTVEHEGSKGQDVRVPAKSTETLQSTAAPSKPPSYRLVGARKASE